MKVTTTSFEPLTLEWPSEGKKKIKKSNMNRDPRGINDQQ